MTRSANIVTYIMHLDLNDLWDHAAERACGITEDLFDRVEWAPTYQFTCPA